MGKMYLLGRRGCPASQNKAERVMKKIISIIFGIQIFALSGCSVMYDCAIGCISPLAVTPTLKLVIDTAFREGDAEVVRRGVPTAIIIMEGLAAKTPDDIDLLADLSLLYFAYAFAFIEDENPAWAGELYLRGRNYGLRALANNDDYFAYTTEKPTDWKSAVAEIGDDELPALFWTALNAGMYVNANRRDPQALIDLPMVLAMMDRVIELDETFFYGGPHLFYGAYYAGLPVMAGGGAVKSQESFEKCAAISGGKFVLVDLFRARYYATLLRDEQIYRSSLEKVLQAPVDIIPEIALITGVAKLKAQTLKENEEKFLYGGGR
jgi:TRAP transporter T-component